MLNTTLAKVRCPACAGTLQIRNGAQSAAPVHEITSGTLECRTCQGTYPILAGVALLIGDVHSYLIEHVKGISRLVADSEIPAPFRNDYLEAQAELRPEHIEEDLEAERVIALYFMNHYLAAKDVLPIASPLIASLVEKYWDEGPLARITQWTAALSCSRKVSSVIELGCGVGGLCKMLEPHSESYLGVDSSFSSIALGRHLSLGAAYPEAIRIPADLLQGPVSREIRLAPAPRLDGTADLVVGHIDALPVGTGEFDLSLALNAIDMLDAPEDLPRIQHEHLKDGGVAIQSCPYIWHASVAEHLREILPENVRDSAQAVEWLYSQNGFALENRADHVPWLFFKHLRQLEIYSVHLLAAKKLR